MVCYVLVADTLLGLNDNEPVVYVLALDGTVLNVM